MKRIFCFLLLPALLLCALLALPCGASAAFDGEITSDCAVLVDAKTGSVLYSKNGDQAAFPASTTKLMTALVVLERVSDLEATATVGSEIWRFSENNTLIGLVDHEEVRIIDLLYGAMLPSGNDAAATLACYVGGSIEGFADLMNQKASELGMDNTHFVNPHGLNDDAHVTTAEDMAKLAVACTQNEQLMEIVGTYQYVMPPTNKRSNEKTITSTNRFLNPESGWSAVTGMKTGSTTPAGGCLVTSAEQDGKSLVCVILGDRSDGYEARWTETRELLEYGFENLSTMALSALDLPAIEVQVAGFTRNDAEAGKLVLKPEFGDRTISGTTEFLTELKAHASEIVVNTPVLETGLDAPIEEGEVVGTATLTYNGQTIAVVNLVATRNVQAAGDASNTEQTAGLITAMAAGGEEGGGSFPWVAVLVAAVLVAAAAFFFLRFRRPHRSAAAAAANRQRSEHQRKKNTYYVYRGK